MTHDEMIAVIQAAKAGKTLQYFDPSDDQWRDVSGYSHLCTDSLIKLLSVPGRFIRVKPEAREWWVIANYSNDKHFKGVFYTDRGAATLAGDFPIHVREILD